jgi:hypothetical protein
MYYAMIALAVLGIMIGILFRFRTLLAAVGIVFLASIGFSIESNFSLLATLATVMAAQALLQAGYFVGLIGKTAVSAHRERARQAVRRYGDQSRSDPGVPRIIFSLLGFLTL